MLNPDQREELLGDFSADYQLAWTASGKPAELAMGETLVAALDGEQPAPGLHALWVFYRANWQRMEIPINWYATYTPQKSSKQVFKLFESAQDLREFLEHGIEGLPESLRVRIENVGFEFMNLASQLKPDEENPDGSKK